MYLVNELTVGLMWGPTLGILIEGEEGVASIHMYSSNNIHVRIM